MYKKAWCTSKLIVFLNRPIALAVVVAKTRDFKIQRRGRRRKRQKNKWFYNQNNNFARASRPLILYISLPVFVRLRRENA